MRKSVLIEYFKLQLIIYGGKEGKKKQRGFMAYINRCPESFQTWLPR